MHSPFPGDVTISALYPTPIVTFSRSTPPSQNDEIKRWSLPISTFSALGVSHVMRYINVQYLFTYVSFQSTNHTEFL